jgi:hypothetical protein
MRELEHWGSVPAATHIHGIRVDHVQAPERAVRVNRPSAVDGPIIWDRMTRTTGTKLREGQGRSGLVYRVRNRHGWTVTVASGSREEVEIGSSRLQDHALALAGMWEQAVLSGRIDMS